MVHKNRHVSEHTGTTDPTKEGAPVSCERWKSSSRIKWYKLCSTAAVILKHRSYRGYASFNLLVYSCVEGMSELGIMGYIISWLCLFCSWVFSWFSHKKYSCLMASARHLRKFPSFGRVSFVAVYFPDFRHDCSIFNTFMCWHGWAFSSFFAVTMFWKKRKYFRQILPAVYILNPACSIILNPACSILHMWGEPAGHPHLWCGFHFYLGRGEFRVLVDRNMM